MTHGPQAYRNFAPEGYISVRVFCDRLGKNYSSEVIRRLKERGDAIEFGGGTVVREGAAWPFGNGRGGRIPLWKRAAIAQGVSG